MCGYVDSGEEWRSADDAAPAHDRDVAIADGLARALLCAARIVVVIAEGHRERTAVDAAMVVDEPLVGDGNLCHCRCASAFFRAGRSDRHDLDWLALEL